VALLDEPVESTSVVFSDVEVPSDLGASFAARALAVGGDDFKIWAAVFPLDTEWTDPVVDCIEPFSDGKSSAFGIRCFEGVPVPLLLGPFSVLRWLLDKFKDRMFDGNDANC
jgi:hypothetical protein